jgi:putative ABC transport system substrate-binding protein
MTRRRFVMAAAALLLPTGARAQAGETPRVIGFLNARLAPNELDTAFRAGLRELGYVEGRTIRIDYRWGAATEEQAEKLAAELAARKVEVIVTATTAAVSSAMRVTRRIPIVMAAAADPVGAGLVSSLARPGGNVTGLTLVSTDTAQKRLQLLRELLPAARRVAVLLEGAPASGRGDKVNALLIEQLQGAAGQLGMSLAVHRATSPAEIDAIFETLRLEGAQALLVQVSRLMIDNRARIVEQAVRQRLPVLYEVEGFADAGGLLSYGPSLADMYRRAAGYVDRILKGAQPAELPIEQPNKYHLVINLKAARSLDLRVPQALLLRADRVIE